MRSWMCSAREERGNSRGRGRNSTSESGWLHKSGGAAQKCQGKRGNPRSLRWWTKCKFSLSRRSYNSVMMLSAWWEKQWESMGIAAKGWSLCESSKRGWNHTAWAYVYRGPGITNWWCKDCNSKLQSYWVGPLKCTNALHLMYKWRAEDTWTVLPYII